MEDCETCGRCLENCPTGAIGGQLAIDVSRCLTAYNEFNEPMPEWICPNIHHALIGCMRCQEVCPVNKSVFAIKKEAIELNEAETEAFLTLSSEELPHGLTQKLQDYGINYLSFAGRNAKLAIEAAAARSVNV